MVRQLEIAGCVAEKGTFVSYAVNDECPATQVFRPRRCAAVAVLVAAALLLAGCTAGDKGSFHRSDAAGSAQQPAPAPKPHDCDKNPGNSETERFPATVDPAGCVWRDSAESVGQAGNALVLWGADHDGFRLRAIDINNGGLLWQSEAIKLGDAQAREGDYEKFFDKGKYPIMLTKGASSYAAVATQRYKRASAIGEASVTTVLRFYPVNSTGTVPPRTYEAPIGDFKPPVDENDTARDGDQVLLRKEGSIDEPVKYLRVDPETAQGNEFAPQGRFAPEAAETPVVVTEDGNVVVTFRQTRGLTTITDRFGLRSADGKQLWDGKDHAPSGADPSAGTVIGVRGRYLIVKWLPEGTADQPISNNTRPGIIALHDFRSGKVIAASERLSIKETVDFDHEINRTAASADGRYLVVGRAVFDLREKKALASLPEAFTDRPIQAISPQGVAYGYGNDNRPVAYDFVQKKVVWEMLGGEGAALLPKVLSQKVAVFQIHAPSFPIVALPLKAPDQPSPNETNPRGPDQQSSGN
ncbi:MAG: hypothetical protein DLM55_00605 [Acidimicrobiales bacterium]|nr:MAG: hypothetical protein DLM55_00605 [Acidimicrobiales bacterium]